VVADGVKVRLQLTDVESFVFPPDSDGLVKVRTRKGDEAGGKLTGVTRLFGKTESGRIVFIRLVEGESYQVRSIRF